MTARPTHRLRTLLAALSATLLLAPMGAVVAHDDDPTDEAALRGLRPPVGFASTPWAAVASPTNLEWGPDGRLYVLSLHGDVTAITPVPDSENREVAVPTPLDDDFYSTDVGPPTGVGVPFYSFPGVVTTNGLAVDPDEPGTIYVSEWYSQGGHTWGRVFVISDTTGDGRGDTRELMLDGLPGGQHWVNDMAVNPVDGKLYVTNGNRTDNGIECTAGQCGEETDRPEYQWRAGGLLRIDRSARDLGPDDPGVEVVAEGMRNLYDVAFWPPDPSVAFIPINGPQDPAADDVLYATNVHDGNVDDMGFPSCLISPHERSGLVTEVVSGLTGDEGGHEHGQGLEPVDSPDEAVIDRFGPCDADEVVWPVASFGGHASANGLAFSHGSSFPGTYGNDLFVALWGSLEAAHATAGHKLVRVNLRDDGTVATDESGMPWVQEFATGGAPLDVTFGPDGAMYVADQAGVIQRIAWVEGFVPPNDEHFDHDHGQEHDHGDDPCEPGDGNGGDDGAGTGPGQGRGPGGGQGKGPGGGQGGGQGQGPSGGQGKGPGGGGPGDGDCPDDHDDGHDDGFDYRTVDPDTYATPDHPAYDYEVGDSRHHDVLFRRLWGCDVDHPYFAWLVDTVGDHITEQTPDIRMALLNGYVPMSPVPNDFGYPETYWHWWHLGHGPQSHPERDDPDSWNYRDAIVQPHNWIEYLLMVPEHVAYPHREHVSWVVEGVMFAIPHDGPGPNLYGAIPEVQEHPCNPFHDHGGIDNPHFHIWPWHHIHPLSMNPPHLCTDDADMKTSTWLWRDTWHCVYDGDAGDPDIGEHDPDNPWRDGDHDGGHEH